MMNQSDGAHSSLTAENNVHTKNGVNLCGVFLDIERADWVCFTPWLLSFIYHSWSAQRVRSIGGDAARFSSRRCYY